MSRATGQWDHKLDLTDIWKNDEVPFEQQRDEVVKRIREAAFYTKHVHDGSLPSLEDIVDSLAQADDEDEFDEYWQEFYDWCDRDKRVWVGTLF